MSWKLLLRTIRYLKPNQIWYQILYRLKEPKYLNLEASVADIPHLIAETVVKCTCFEGQTFTFLNQSHEFSGWNCTGNGMLWAYNQNYFDWINQERISPDDCCRWIDKFIVELPDNHVGLDPYPTALRTINWIKFFSRCPECATKERLNSLYSQIRHLERRLEYHLLGNHLLEDAYALFIGACYFNDGRLKRKAKRLLMSQLEEQILPDGAHYEQSPMYHCILLDRLLDYVNIADSESRVELKKYAVRMLGHLESIVWNDKTIPLLNDAALNIAPTPEELFEYAKRLKLEWTGIPMVESGFRKMRNGRIEAVVDVGNIMATYQPGHSHADALTYELRIDGGPVVVDTGISTYDKTPRRQYERSTSAHNCVVVEGQDSDEVWGGFRVGNRCKVSIIKERANLVEASHDGFGMECRRTFEVKDGMFIVEDRYEGDAVSYIHLAHGVGLDRVTVDGASSIEILDTKYSVEYKRFVDNKTIAIHFNGVCRYSIR